MTGGPHPVPEMRGDLGRALALAAGLTVAGIPLGLLWAAVAPGRTRVVVGARGASLAAGGSPGLDATAVFALLAAVLGVLAGALSWRWRRRRGPVVLLATVLGALGAGAVGAVLGPAVASGRPSVPVLLDASRLSPTGAAGPPVPGLMQTLPPDVATPWVLLVPALGATLGYLVPLVLLAREDLGRPDSDSGVEPGTEGSVVAGGHGEPGGGRPHRP